MLWFLLLLFVLTVYFSGAFNAYSTDRQTQNKPDALSVLNERYARGELSTSEYTAMKRNLTTH